MAFPLSRVVRDDVSMEQFMDGLLEFLKHSMKDPQNNIGELDKSLSEMLERKILCVQNPRSGLMFNNPSATAYILQHPFLLQLLFYPRVFIRKHEWPILYLSPMSRHLCTENLFSKLPSIYVKYGREIDLNRGIIYLSTVDYFFMSFISYPLIVGRSIPVILNALYSSYKYEYSVDSSHNNDSWFNYFNIGKNDDKCGSLPINPFKQINAYYSEIFSYYLNVFLSSSSHCFGVKLIEIIGELWFAQSFCERPIGDRCSTLPLMQDLLFIIIGKQIEYQNEYSASTSSSSCICDEFRCLLRYLYSFFRESFCHFPLDFIAHLRIIIEMLVYVLAPWSVEYKLTNPDKNLKLLKEREEYEYGERRRKEEESFLSKIIKKYILNNNNNNNNKLNNNNLFLNNKNDDRLRSLNINNTEFDTALKLINYELEGIESFNIAIWKEYIIEMLPFYSNLIHDFIDTLLKYDFAHVLKQLPVLKVLHIYSNTQIIQLIRNTERIVFNPFHIDNNSHSNNEAMYVLNLIQEITLKSINDYKCLPFQNNQTQTQTKTAVNHLYIKCRKVMLRLSQNNNNNKTLSYFIDPTDNVRIIRYIIGELESLFQIGPKQQQNLMNVSIMYEPSQSNTPSPQQTTQPETPPQSNNENIWNKPKGEWESFYALKIQTIFYTKIIKNTKFNDVYLKYLAKYHRLYCTDKRVATWTILACGALCISYAAFCTVVILFFVLVIVLPNTRMG